MRGSSEDVEQKGKRTGMTRATAFRLAHAAHSRRFQWWLAGAILHALRPVVYLAALMLFGQRAWAPWFVSLLVDILAQALATWCDSPPPLHTFLPMQLECPPPPRNSARRSTPGPLAAAPSHAALTRRAGARVDSRIQRRAAARAAHAAAGAAGAGDALQEVGPADEHAAARGAGAEAPRSGGDGAGARGAVFGCGGGVEEWERGEVQRRRGLLLMYLLRSPAFERVVQPLLELLQVRRRNPRPHRLCAQASA